jgi:hypothetical protein
MNIYAASLPTTGRRLAGWTCATGGLIGAASGLVTAFVTPAVDSHLYRYPYSPHAYAAAQVIFAANHFMLLVWTGLGVALIRDRDGSAAVEVL